MTIRVRRPGGFTLVELIITMTIIIILIGIALRITFYVKDRVTEAKTLANAQLIMMALENYKQDWGDYPVCGIKKSEFDGATDANKRVMLKNSSLWLWRALANDCYPNISSTTGVRGGGYLARLSGLEDRFITAYPVEYTQVNTTLVDSNFQYFLDAWGEPFVYLHWKESESGDIPANLNTLPGGESIPTGQYYLFTLGPDGDSDSVGGDWMRPSPSTATDKDNDNIWLNERMP